MGSLQLPRGTHLHWSSPHVAPTCTGFPMNHSLRHSLREITQLQSQIILSGVSLHACVCTHVQVCTHICVCGGQRSTVGDFFICSLHYCLRHDLSLNIVFQPCQSGWPVSPRDVSASASPALGSITGACYPAWLFTWVLGIQTQVHLLARQTLDFINT